LEIEKVDSDFIVDARMLGELFGIAAADVPKLMGKGQISSLCEAGSGEHAGEHRLTFYYRNCRVRLRVDANGSIIQRSKIDFGEKTMPRALRQAGA